MRALDGFINRVFSSLLNLPCRPHASRQLKWLLLLQVSLCLCLIVNSIFGVRIRWIDGFTVPKLTCNHVNDPYASGPAHQAVYKRFLLIRQLYIHR